ncbi:hypothetical protein H632_c773p0 [Helicosporidium sp. ATCC 50920]|nr:hypothetical protein H632_c773p0 [Helicosporidium sp. ATCC 50920]|eukprot:KDD75274.1 hypothetical protein H632_c773p0 [Helicosporidium sp. ATCC 50920]
MAPSPRKPQGGVFKRSRKSAPGALLLTPGTLTSLHGYMGSISEKKRRRRAQSCVKERGEDGGGSPDGGLVRRLADEAAYFKELDAESLLVEESQPSLDEQPTPPSPESEEGVATSVPKRRGGKKS